MEIPTEIQLENLITNSLETKKNLNLNTANFQAQL